MPIKRTISGMAAVDLAEYWLNEADGDRDDAVELVRGYVSCRRPQETVIAAIDFVLRRDEAQRGEP